MQYTTIRYPTSTLLSKYDQVQVKIVHCMSMSMFILHQHETDQDMDMDSKKFGCRISVKSLIQFDIRHNVGLHPLQARKIGDSDIRLGPISIITDPTYGRMDIYTCGCE